MLGLLLSAPLLNSVLKLGVGSAGDGKARPRASPGVGPSHRHALAAGTGRGGCVGPAVGVALRVNAPRCVHSLHVSVCAHTCVLRRDLHTSRRGERKRSFQRPSPHGRTRVWNTDRNVFITHGSRFAYLCANPKWTNSRAAVEPRLLPEKR